MIGEEESDARGLRNGVSKGEERVEKLPCVARHLFRWAGACRGRARLRPHMAHLLLCLSRVNVGWFASYSSRMRLLLGIARTE